MVNRGLYWKRFEIYFGKDSYRVLIGEGCKEVMGRNTRNLVTFKLSSIKVEVTIIIINKKGESIFLGREYMSKESRLQTSLQPSVDSSIGRIDGITSYPYTTIGYGEDFIFYPRVVSTYIPYKSAS